MSEEAYGTQSGDADEGGTSSVSDQEALANDESQPSQQEPQGNEQQVTPQYLKEMETRILQEATKRAQSMTDKMGSRLDKEIQSALETATNAIDLGKQAGMKYTPEQEQAIRDKAINAAYAKLNQQTQQSSPQSSAQQPAPQPQDQGNQQGSPDVWISQEVNRIMSETGVYIPADEANKLILGENNENQVTPYQYIQAFDSLARQRQSNTRQPRGPSPAIPSFVTGGKSPTSQSALMQQYQKERAQIRNGTHPTLKRGDIPGIQRLEMAYRAKGLDV